MLNNGDATRRSPATGTETSPDVTICHRSLADKATWEVIEELNSDHRPIITTVYSTVECREKGSKRSVWYQKRGDWDAFRRAVEEAIPNLPRDNPLRMEKALRTCICKAAYEHIGLKKVSNKTPMWMTTEIEEAIKQRDEAKQNRHNDESQYKEADEKVNDLITEKKKGIWKRKVLDSQEAGNVWQMVRNLKNGPRECKNKAIMHSKKTRVTDRQKARAFMSHYKKTSNITLKKADGQRKR